MRTFIKLSFIGLLVAAISLPAKAQEGNKETIAIPLSSPGEKGKLEVGLVNGSINVAAYDGKDVIIEAVAGGGKNDDRGVVTPSGMKRISSNPMELEATEKGNTVKVSTNSWAVTMTLNIKVPKNFDLKLSTVNDGDIDVKGVTGAHEISNVNGEITMTQVGGSTVLNTVNGDIKVTLESVNPEAQMAFTTLNGDVDVTFPAAVKATAKMRSDRGDIFSDFDMVIEKSAPKVDKSSSNGVYKVSIEDWVFGKINGGGKEYLFKTMQGDVYIRKK
ncbi:DUF4097 family beta strand repeat-containing protein [Imperialibacter roseus]|uniref:DUF4097 family beta strand repeat-containing protein n=1 Tax=Imperialibacter roseus TaxID=1324217 RepID=A0ABZ0IQ55_9BACT|nr:DUF4097 family beta strand repeat-containing protein [Imperialibacter roseus]WOK06579.1 DUF4097 family beta strand repeat-containing protein [Imperialibacter roseus]